MAMVPHGRSAIVFGKSSPAFRLWAERALSRGATGVVGQHDSTFDGCMGEVTGTVADHQGWSRRRRKSTPEVVTDSLPLLNL